jgi:thiaminase/transcriptional activator TenA
MGSFLTRLLDDAATIWAKIFAHPFLAELAEGTLPLDKFRFYLQQDHAYLQGFCRFLGAAVAKAETLDQMHWLSDLLAAEFTFEVAMQRALAPRVGLHPDALARAEPAPTTTAYTAFLVSVAATGSIREIVAAMAPCLLSYVAIGARLADRVAACPVDAYRDWCAAYTGDTARRLADDLTARVNALGAVASADDREKMARYFRTASRFEYLFWEMAYKMERWPV